MHQARSLFESESPAAPAPAPTFNLSEMLGDIALLGRRQCGPLQVFYLRTSTLNHLDYTTLDEALAAKEIEISEFSEIGQVPKIKIVNSSPKMVFLMAGEQLVGCKQNRVMNASIMVPAHTEMPLHVSCVERGRWGYQSQQFSSSYTSSHYGLRAMMSGQAARSYRMAGVPGSDQRAVWNEVSRKMEAMGASSPSGALDAVYQRFASRLEEWEQTAAVPSESTGAVFVAAGNIVGADLFDKPETLRKLWPKLIRSCAIDALETSAEPGSFDEEKVVSWLDKGLRGPRETYNSTGVGVDLRIEGDDIVGASLMVEDCPVHTELFPRQTRQSVQAPLPFPQATIPEPPDAHEARNRWPWRWFRK